jgi:CubicO group peptidase (beta-lactamase class C family)
MCLITNMKSLVRISKTKDSKMKIPSHVILIIGLVLIELTTSCAQESLKDLLIKTVSEENLPGMIAAIADTNGILLIESAGVRNIKSSEPITNGDLFHIGSCTKAMTSTMLATLVSNDELRWETTIIDIFPEFRNIIHHDYHNVTLHQIVTHRAGIPANASDWHSYQDLEIIERRLAILKDNLKEPSQIESGKYNYSNLGYMIAGSIAERITGQTWETLIKKHLFEPLGMSSAGFGPPGTINQIDQPWGHKKANGEWQPIQSVNAEALGPAGIVHCTLEDWVKFIALFMTQDKTAILERNQIDKLIIPVGDYACGWGVNERKWAKGIALNHSGSNTIWYVSVWVAPEINRAFIIGTNSYDKDSGKVCDKMIRKLIELNQENL